MTSESFPVLCPRYHDTRKLSFLLREGDRVGHARILHPWNLVPVCLRFPRLSKHPRRGGRHARARARVCSRGGRSGGGLPTFKEGGSFLASSSDPRKFRPRHAFPPPQPLSRDATLATTVTLSSSPESRGGSPGSPASPECLKEERVRVARLARDDWTPPKGERQRRRRGGGIKEGKEGENTPFSLPNLNPSFTERERSRDTLGVPTSLTFVGCPTPSDIVTCRRLPAFGRCSTASHPRWYASFAPFPSVPSTSSRYRRTRPRRRRWRGQRDGVLCHRRAIPSSSSAPRSLSLAFVHRLANRAHRLCMLPPRCSRTRAGSTNLRIVDSRGCFRAKSVNNFIISIVSWE